MNRRRGRQPNAKERALWETVAAGFRRAETAVKPPPAEPPEMPKEASSPPPVPFGASPPPRPLVILRPEGGRPEPSVTLPPPRVKPPTGLDRATESRLRKGKRAPDARLDLHGMTVAAAHSALHAFILRSRTAGRRCVLVITGKGGFGDGAPGVLRRDAPRWLATPPLSEMIVHVSEAHARHGGGGALYVYLKRAR